MPKKEEKILIEHIKERFLNRNFAEQEFNSIKDILELPIEAIRGVSEDELVQIQEIYGCSTIKDLSYLNPINPIEALLPDDNLSEEELEARIVEIIQENLNAFPNFEEFRNHIAVSRMIARAWENRKEYISKKETKVICIGLDNAGKTAILSGLGGKLGITELGKLKPTKKVERRKISNKNMDLYVWDFGGQKSYRREYLESPESYFIGTNLLLYVIDMQDPDRYNESFEYLIEILDIIKSLGESPYILAFMHKSDPDILDDPTFQLNTEYVADKLNYHLNNYDFEFDIYTTSIYNFFTSEPKFSKYIKDVLSDKESLNNPVVRKIQGLDEIIDSILTTIVTLANSLGEQIAKLSAKINEYDDKYDGLFSRVLVLEETFKTANLSQLQTNVAQQKTNKIDLEIKTEAKKLLEQTYSSSKSRNVFWKKPKPSERLTPTPTGLTPPPSGLTPPPNRLNPPPKNHITQNPTNHRAKSDDSGGIADARANIMNELSALFQAKKNLDKTAQVSKLGPLGRQFVKKKMTKRTNKDRKQSISAAEDENIVAHAALSAGKKSIASVKSSASKRSKKTTKSKSGKKSSKKGSKKKGKSKKTSKRSRKTTKKSKKTKKTTKKK